MLWWSGKWFCQSLGVASSTLSKIFNCSSARCWSSDSYNPVPGVMEGVPSSRDYNGGFASKLMVNSTNWSRILGLGDWSSWKWQSIGKLDLYIAAAGINPKGLQKFRLEWLSLFDTVFSSKKKVLMKATLRQLECSKESPNDEDRIQQAFYKEAECTFTTVYHRRPMPFGAIFRCYPGMWKVFSDDKARPDRYLLAKEFINRPYYADLECIDSHSREDDHKIDLSDQSKDFVFSKSTHLYTCATCEKSIPQEELCINCGEYWQRSRDPDGRRSCASSIHR
ncbi:hypothetical protein Ahy_B07g087683 isoform A [Arachis hypogaea]|uniref:DUF1995 domain-containing protein n=1 Tax=Arachis hypogaea TaxID=3818 RepID=A0A444YCR0_ARAHY|nr:hypothetical protein Ahy_B07g087683 isoform A [Arachis hypogaea]